MTTRTTHRAALALLLTLPFAAQASSIVTSRAALAGDDWVDWSATGRISDPGVLPPVVNFLASIFDVASADGLEVGVQIATTTNPLITPPFVFQTGLSADGKVPTNFAPGDYILFTGLNPSVHPSPGNPGPITIRFATPVRAAGAQLAVDDMTRPYSLFVSAYDALDNLLDSFELKDARSSVLLDNSAVFLGVRGDTANIAKLVYTSSISDRAIGMNRLDIVTAAPEPGGFFATGLLILAGRRFAPYRARPSRNLPPVPGAKGLSLGGHRNG